MKALQLLAIGVLVAAATATPLAQAQTYTVLYSFTGSPDGRGPGAPVIRDSAGNLNAHPNCAGLGGVLLLALAAPAQPLAAPTYIEFDAPGAGTGAGQGTFANAINKAGTIAGTYIDANNVFHGYVRAVDGTITSFDAPRAGTGA